MALSKQEKGRVSCEIWAGWPRQGEGWTTMSRCGTSSPCYITGGLFPLWWERRGWIPLHSTDCLSTAPWGHLHKRKWEYELKNMSWACGPVLAYTWGVAKSSQGPLVSDHFLLCSSNSSTSLSMFSSFSETVIWLNCTDWIKISIKKFF